MRHLTVTTAAAVLALGATCAPVSAWPQRPSQGQSSDQQLKPVASEFESTVQGTVTSVDRQSGRLTLNTVDGPLTVRFTPSAVQNVNPGDKIVVGFAIVEPAPSASPNTAPSGTPGLTPSGAQPPPEAAGAQSGTGSSAGSGGSSPHGTRGSTR